MKTKTRVAGAALALLLTLGLLPAALPVQVQAAAGPAKPKISAAAAAGNKAARVQWKKVKKIKGFKGYEVWSATSKNGKYKRAGKTTGTAYTVKKLKPGKTYYIKVRSYAKVSGQTLYSAYSAAKKVKIPKKAKIPGATSGLTASATQSEVNLAWAGVAGASGYEVQRAATGGGRYTTVGTARGTAYRDAAGTPGQVYDYRVRAYFDVYGEKVYGPFGSAATNGIIKVTSITCRTVQYIYNSGIMVASRPSYILVITGGSGTITINERTWSSLSSYAGQENNYTRVLEVKNPGTWYYQPYIYGGGSLGVSTPSYGKYQMTCGNIKMDTLTIVGYGVPVMNR